jgi:8-oxo-dGTP pyrophosphatase MutT (NUDIX family)
MEVGASGGEAESGNRNRVFPLRRLPPGFLRSLDNPPDPPVRPRPSATLVLMRKGSPGLEVLLLQRSPNSGFIPGAWVFPGGTVDRADDDSGIRSRLHGITLRDASRRLESSGSEPSALAFWVTALRETFEETGILLHRREGVGNPGPSPTTEIETLARNRLLSGEMSFKDVLEGLDLTLDAGALEYCGHWVTPECEPRRYETRFFAAEVRRGVSASPHAREAVVARWVTPADALTGNREGTLPLVFPTLSTLEELVPFRTPREALNHFRGKAVPRCLPKVERVPDGILFHLPD